MERSDGVKDVTDEDLIERFEIDAKGVIRWREVVPIGGQRFALRAAARLNRMAGKPVLEPQVNLYGRTIWLARLRAVLLGETVVRKKTAPSGSKGGVKASGLPQGVTLCRGRYRAHIFTGDALRHLGMFGSLDEAVAARRQAEIEKEAANG